MNDSLKEVTLSVIRGKKLHIIRVLLYLFPILALLMMRRKPISEVLIILK